MKEYIEREAAIKVFHDKYGALCSQDALFAILMTLKDVPAADVVPVRHGRWIPKNTDGSWRVETCSECKKDTHYVRFAPAYDYCPNCGAVMYKDGDGE